MASNSLNLDGTIKSFKQQMAKDSEVQIPIGYVRYPIIQSLTGNTYTVRFAGSEKDIPAKKIAGLPTIANGSKAFAIQYSTGEGFELVVIGALS